MSICRCYAKAWEYIRRSRCILVVGQVERPPSVARPYHGWALRVYTTQTIPQVRIRRIVCMVGWIDYFSTGGDADLEDFRYGLWWFSFSGHWSAGRCLEFASRPCFLEGPLEVGVPVVALHSWEKDPFLKSDGFSILSIGGLTQNGLPRLTGTRSLRWLTCPLGTDREIALEGVIFKNNMSILSVIVIPIIM